MRAVENTSADHDPAVLAVPTPPGATSVISGDLDSSERYTMGYSVCLHQRLLLAELLAREKSRLLPGVSKGPRPLSTRELVQLLVVSTRYVPPTARRLLAPSELPPALERVAIRAKRGSQTWVAWTDEARTWFVVAEMATVPGPHCQGGAIRMFFYDEDGRFVSWGTWALQSDCSWMLCER